MNFTAALMLINRGYCMKLPAWNDDCFLRRSHKGEKFHPTLVKVQGDDQYPKAFITADMLSCNWVFSKRSCS